MQLVDTTTMNMSVLDAVVDARMEIVTFVCGIVVYAIMSQQQKMQQGLKAKLKNKLSEDEAKYAESFAAKSVESESPTPKRKEMQAQKRMPESPKVDVAKHIVGMRKCASEGNLKGATDIFETLKGSGVELNSIIYNTVLDACVKCGDLNAATAWMEKTKEAGMLDAVSFNTLMKAFLAKNDLSKARQLMKQMKHEGFQPNSVTFNELINNLVVGGGSRTAIWEVIQEMKALGVSPNQVTCSILLKQLNARSTDSDINNTMEIVSSLDEPMDEVLLSSVVEACVRIGKPALLTSKLRQLESSRKLAVKSSHTFGSLIKAYGYANDMDGVWRSWKQMRAKLIKPSSITLGCMIEAMVNNGCTEDAYEMIHQLQTDSQCRDLVNNSVIYCTLLKGFTREKKLERAWAVYEEMEEKNLEMSLVTFNTVVDACARVGRMDQLPKIMMCMKRHNVEPNIITYSTMLKGHCLAGDIEMGFSVLNQMQHETKLKPDEIMFNSLLDGCAQNGLHEQGMQLFHEMERARIPPSNFTLSILVKMMNRARKVDQAFDLVKELTQKYKVKPNVHVYTNLIQACVSNRRHARALTVVETMVKEGVQLDSRTYGVLIRSSLFQNQPEQATALLRAALGLPGGLALLADSRVGVCYDLDNKCVNDTLCSLADRGLTESLVGPILADIKKCKLKVWINPALQKKVVQN